MKNRFSLIFLSSLFIALILVWSAVFSFEKPLEVFFFAIGQGDATLIQYKTNQILIDGGPNNLLLEKLGKAMPFWDKKIELVILTHPDSDHLTGLLEVLKRYQVERVLETGVKHNSLYYARWQKLVKEKQLRVTLAQAGEVIKISRAGFLNILWPWQKLAGETISNLNNTSIVSRLRYGKTSFLLMADAESPTEKELISKGFMLAADVLKIGHHGSRTSSSEEFLKAVMPGLAIISVGKKNRYGHPTATVLERLKSKGIPVLRTDQVGDIKIQSNGQELQVFAP